MLAFWGALAFAGFAFKELEPWLRGTLLRAVSGWGQKKPLLEARAVLWTLEEGLQSGWLPPPERWQQLSRLPEPWGGLCAGVLQQLRSAGAPLLPTLKRLRAAAERELALLEDARARVAQAWAQAVVGLALAPIFAVTLGWLLPEIGAQGLRWVVVSGLATAWSALGAFWLLTLAARARRAGLPATRAHWPVVAQLAGERFLALLRSGQPSDLAWAEACNSLGHGAPELARAWTRSAWWGSDPAGGPPSPSELSGAAEALFVETGEAVRRAVQASVMEGRPCHERVEGVLATLRERLGAETERQLGLLPARALKPLFLCTAPALLGLLGAALALSAGELP